ncbi:MAG TPA: hypothetical protein VK027_05330, partial [Chitinophagaceae bacterium]|nr:hypothetical protein [Chitinophagaceae bacterium]
IQIDLRNTSQETFGALIENIEKYEGATTLSINLLDTEKNRSIDMVGEHTKVLLNEEFLDFLKENQVKYIIETK